jgi:hypothetical protein
MYKKTKDKQFVKKQIVTNAKQATATHTFTAKLLIFSTVSWSALRNALMTIRG